MDALACDKSGHSYHLHNHYFPVLFFQNINIVLIY